MKETLLAVLPVDVLRYIQGTLIESCSLVPHSKASAKHEINKLTAFPMISIAVPKGSQNGLTSEVIAEYWSKTFGVTVVLNTVPVTIYSNNPKENPYDFCLITWIADYLDPMAFLELFKSDSSYNLGNYYNSDYDNILEEANRKTGNERLELLEKAETILLEDGTILPLSVALATNFIQKELIEGWFSNPLDIHLFKYIKIARNN